MLDGGRQRDHLLDPAALIRAVEVLTYPAPQVNCGADVEHLARRPTEQVDTWPARQPVGQHSLAPLCRRHVGQIRAQVGVSVHTLIADALDERVQYVDGGPRVVERPVGGLAGDGEQPGQRCQPHAGSFLAAEHPAGQLDGAQHLRPPPSDAAPIGGGPQKPDVEPGVVGHQHRAAGELEKHRQHRADGRGIAHHRRGDAGQLHDLRRDAALRVDEGGELAQYHTAAHFDRPDFGDRVGGRPLTSGHAPAGGLQVHDDECGLAQRYFGSPVEVGEAQLLASGRAHGRDVRQSHRHCAGLRAARRGPSTEITPARYVGAGG